MEMRSGNPSAQGAFGIWFGILAGLFSLMDHLRGGSEVRVDSSWGCWPTWRLFVEKYPRTTISGRLGLGEAACIALALT